MNHIQYFLREMEEVDTFQAFGLVHIGLIFIALFGCIWILKRHQESRRLELGIGWVLLIQQVSLYLWYTFGTSYVLAKGLPLYHCRLAILFLSIGLILNQQQLMKISAYWGIVGSIVALLIPKLDPFSFPHITQFSYFIGHILLLWGATYLLGVKKVGMNQASFKQSSILTNLYHIFVFFLNHRLGSNYGYMSSSPIGIGNEFHPVFYGIIVMTLFQGILWLEFKFINFKIQHQVSHETLSEELERLESYH